jgi:hypothetical protein
MALPAVAALTNPALVFTIRNAGGVALLLFGSAFLLLTPEFATPGVDTTVEW